MEDLDYEAFNQYVEQLDVVKDNKLAVVKKPVVEASVSKEPITTTDTKEDKTLTLVVSIVGAVIVILVAISISIIIRRKKVKK